MLRRGLSALVLLSGLAVSGTAQVVLSEVSYDPTGADDGLEKIELFNPTSSAVDLTRWSICLNNPQIGADRFYYAFAAGRSVAPGAFVTVHWRASGAGDAGNIFTNSEGMFLFGIGSAPIDNGAFALSLYEDDNAVWSSLDFARSDLIRDFLQLGSSNLLRESVAVAAGIWFDNDRIVDRPEGWSIVYDGTGDASSDWFGDPSGYTAGSNGIPTTVASTFGAGCAGSGGFAPQIPPADQIPMDSTTGFQLSLVHGLGGAKTLLLVGVQQISVPFGAGCTLLVAPDFFLGPFTLQELGAGMGTLQLAGTNPIAGSGATFFFQYLILDPGTTKGSLIASNGLSITF